MTKKNKMIVSSVLAVLLTGMLSGGCMTSKVLSSMSSVFTPTRESIPMQSIVVEDETTTRDTTAETTTGDIEETTPAVDETTAAEATAEETTAQSVSNFKFKAFDLDGNIVTGDIFTQYDITVVNVWGTFCGPCISEMPDLGKWASKMPDNVNIIGVVCDISDANSLKDAQDIVSQTGADTYTHLYIGDTDDLYNLVEGCMYVPTTFFFDRNGKQIGKEIVGVNVEGYKSAVEEYLKSIGK